MPTPMTLTQRYDAPASKVFALFSDRAFVEGRLAEGGGLDPELVTFEPGAAGDAVTIVTRQGIPASVLPSMVTSMMPGDPSTERREDWRPDGEGYVADFSVTIKGAPASLKGTMRLAPAGPASSTVQVDGQASVPVPLFGGKIEAVIVEQIGNLLVHEEQYTRARL